MDCFLSRVGLWIGWVQVQVTLLKNWRFCHWKWTMQSKLRSTGLITSVECFNFTSTTALLLLWNTESIKKQSQKRKCSHHQFFQRLWEEQEVSSWAAIRLSKLPGAESPPIVLCMQDWQPERWHRNHCSFCILAFHSLLLALHLFVILCSTWDKLGKVRLVKGTLICDVSALQSLSQIFATDQCHQLAIVILRPPTTPEEILIVLQSITKKQVIKVETIYKILNKSSSWLSKVDILALQPFQMKAACSSIQPLPFQLNIEHCNSFLPGPQKDDKETSGSFIDSQSSNFIVHMFLREGWDEAPCFDSLGDAFCCLPILDFTFLWLEVVEFPC